MKEVFRPAMALMNRLKYPHKFALISLLFAFPLALVLYFLVSQINTGIDIAQKELYGTAYLRPLRQLLEHVPQHSLLAQSSLAGDVAVRGADLLHKQSEIEADVQALQAADQRVGTWLDTTDKLRTRSANWQDLKERLPLLQAGESDALHTRLIADIRALMSHVGDTSTLILDPDLDSYYLMDAVLLKLPDSADLLARARATGVGIIAQKTLTAEDRAQLIVLAGLLKANIGSRKAGMEVAFRDDSLGTLKANLEAPLTKSLLTTEEFIETLNNAIINAQAITMQPAAYLASVTQALDASSSLWDSTVNELDRLLQARIDRFVRRKNLVATVTALVLVIVAYLFAGFYLTVTSTIAKLDEASQRMVSGDLDALVDLDNRDELGQVVQSFNTIATRLRAEWAQAQEESSRARRAEAALRERTATLQQTAAQLDQRNQALVEQQHRLRAELAEAAAYVASRLPPPLTGGVQVTWQFIPSEQLGGDAFGYHWLDDEHFAMYLLDVCGHGVGAALLSASIINVLHTQSLPGTDFHDPAAVLQALNDRFPMEQHRNMFFTMWYGVYDQRQGRLVYASGGHPPAILLTGATANDIRVVRLHTPGGLVLGYQPGITFARAVCALEACSTLYLFSDGVYEIAQPDGTVLSFDAFVGLLTRLTPSERSTLDHIVDAMRAISGREVFADDVSMLQITFR